MARFEFVSPGAAAAGALKKFMIEQEVKKRQDMLDSMATEREARLLKSTDANIANMQENTKSLIEQRDMNVKDRKRADFSARYGTVGVGGQMSPEMQKEADELGMSHLYAKSPDQVTQGAHQGVDEQGVDQYEVKTTPGVIQATGTPEQRQVEQKKAAVGQILRSNPELMKHPGIKAAFEYAQATGDHAGLYNAIAQMTRGADKPTIQPGSFGEYVDATPERRAQLEVDRKKYGQADDRPFAPVVIQTVTPDGKPTQKIVERKAGDEYAAGQTSTEKDRQAGIGRSGAVLDSISELSEKINTGAGLMAKITGEAEKIAAKANYDDDVAEYQALISGFTPLVARAVGHTGVLTEQDVASVRELFPKPGDSKTLRDRKIKRVLTVMGAMNGGGPQEQQPPSAAPAAAPSGNVPASGTTFIRVNGKLVPAPAR